MTTDWIIAETDFSDTTGDLEELHDTIQGLFKSCKLCFRQPVQGRRPVLLRNLP